jgi:hypothetical protein
MFLPQPSFHFGLLTDRNASNRLLTWSLIVVILAFLLNPSNAFGQRRRTPAQRRAPVTQTAPATPVTEDDDSISIDPTIVAESQRAQQRESAERKKLESVLLTRNEPSETSVDELWRGYRQAFPFHSQVIALSEPASDGSRTLIISEPPPHVTLGDILIGIGTDLLLNHRIMKQRVGYDGWVKDVAIAIKGNDNAVRAMLSRLNQQLFLTSYKSYTLKLPVRISTRTLDLNLTVTPEELNQWVIKEAEQFFPVEGGSAETFSSLSRQTTAGVYISHKRGLIGWWIPKKRNMYECRASARQFALDSDLIVGALANQSGVFIVAREREIPVDVLPPLRFETLALLADVQEGQRGALAQSYQRNHDFAGRVPEGKDWAPILLSPQLRDTEYGSLLNITDQLLKGWSNGGETKYENFPYPIPAKYPFPKPLPIELGIASSNGSLTYNWNTKGVGFTVDYGPLTLLALNRTGALPVSYIPEGARLTASVTVAEDTGYNYFSGIGDPNLARVVQYAALYQIFSAFDVAQSDKPIPSDSYPDQLLESMTAELRNSLKQASDAEIQTIAENLEPSLRLELDESISISMKKYLEDTEKELHRELLAKNYPPNTKDYTDKFNSVMADVKKKAEEQVRQNLVNEIKEQLLAVKIDHPVTDASDRAQRRDAMSRYADYKQMPKRYAAAIDQRVQGWIHTPVVVVSWNNANGGVGGHNLDARVSRIKVDETLPPGQVHIDETGALVINSVDVPRVRAFARRVERNNLYRDLALASRDNNTLKVRAVQAEIQQALTKADVAAVRPREGALQLSVVPPSKPPVNKPPITNAEPAGVGGAGWGGNGRSSLPIASDSRRLSQGAVRIKSRGNSFDIEYANEAGTNAFQLTGLTHEDAVDVAALQVSKRAKSGEAVVVEFDGLPEQKAVATLRSIEIQTAATGSPMELVGRISEGQIVGSPEAMTGKYNFNLAKVEIGEIKTLETGELQGDIALNVPARDSSGQSVSFTSELRFHRSTPREVIAAVTSKVSTRMANLAKAWSRRITAASNKLTVEKYNADLARSIKRIRTRTKLNFDVKSKLNFSVGSPQGLRDIYIGKNLFGYAEAEFAVGS